MEKNVIITKDVEKISKALMSLPESEKNYIAGIITGLQAAKDSRGAGYSGTHGNVRR